MLNDDATDLTPLNSGINKCKNNCAAAINRVYATNYNVVYKMNCKNELQN